MKNFKIRFLKVNKKTPKKIFLIEDDTTIRSIQKNEKDTIFNDFTRFHKRIKNNQTLLKFLKFKI